MSFVFEGVSWLACGSKNGWTIDCCGYSTEIEFFRDANGPTTFQIWRSTSATDYDLVAVTATETTTNDGRNMIITYTCIILNNISFMLAWLSKYTFTHNTLALTICGF